MRSNGSPAVSVVLPAYRVTRYVAQALESVLTQTYPPHEVIVVNDECPDTAALESELAPFMDRITYLTRPNGGPGAARNTGIRAASGELVAFLDADDYWGLDFLERQVGLLETGEGRDLVYSDALYVDDNGEVVGSLMERSPSEGEADLAALLSGRCTVATSTVVARKACLESAGLFDEDVGNYSEDFDLWCRVAYTGGRIDYQRRRLVFHRVHDESLTAAPLALPKGALRVLDKIRRTMDLSPRERHALEQLESSITSEVLAGEAKQAILRKDYRDAKEKLARSVELKPNRKRRLVLAGLHILPGPLAFIWRRYGRG